MRAEVPRVALVLVTVVSVVACASDPTPGSTPRRERLARIRDAAAELGVFNAALLGGIAVSETNLAHCWSEATYACKGPTSPSCDGPIIAGSADGPCADMQGGLGMFQFDAGTWSDTLATYGDAILTEAGNTAQAVHFVVTKIEQDVVPSGSWLTATDWLNRVPLIAGEPMTEQWAERMACRYNGCCTTSALCQTRAAGYRDHAIALIDELGPAFWRTADRCGALPDGGVVAPHTACYLAAGDPRTWHPEPDGRGGQRVWATTAAAGAAADSFIRWTLHATGRYQLAARVTGGAATARYRLAHGGALDTVEIDQATAVTDADGFTVLGDVDLTGAGSEGSEYVELGITSATPGQKLVIDAVRVTPR